MQKVSRITKSVIEEITELVNEGREVRYTLPGGGKLSIDNPLPYIIIYRRIKGDNDPATVRLVLSEASYLVIGSDDDFAGYQELIACLCDILAGMYKACLLFEIWAGPSGSSKFIIKGPKKDGPSATNILTEKLESLTSVFPRLNLAQEVRHVEDRHPDGARALLNEEEINRTGSLVLGLEIPPVYFSGEGEIYPVFFRGFHDKISEIFRVAIYEFIRIQTTAGVSSYAALGRGSIDEAVWDIDKRLAEIEESFRFLLLVAPTNIREVREIFFKSGFEEVTEYHYRLLPIDPDILKRELYSLRIEDIDDPTLAYLFREKREELDREITMLQERGTASFFYNSIRLYDGVEAELQEEAIDILQNIQEDETSNLGECVNAIEFKEMAEKEYEFLRQQYPPFNATIHLRDDVNIMMVSQGELYIPEETLISKKDAEALIQHEVGTHVLTYWNGHAQPFRQLACGLAGYDSLQEGLAVLSEYLVGGLTGNRFRMLAGRVEAAAALINGADFVEIFRLLHSGHGFTKARAFGITSRVFQGGGFIKDVIYLRGLMELCMHLRSGGEYEPLLVGKIALRHLPAMMELKARNVLNEMPALPRFLGSEESKERLKMIKKGLPLAQMVNA